MCIAEQFVYLNALIYTIPVETNAECQNADNNSFSVQLVCHSNSTRAGDLCKPHICLDGDYSLLHLDSLISLGYDSTRLLRAYVTNELLQ